MSRKGGRGPVQQRAMQMALLGLSFVAASAQAGRWPRYGGSIGVVVGHVPHEASPTSLHGDAGNQIGSCLFEGLTRLGTKGVEPALALRWFHSDDQRRWVFELRPNVHFHDGSMLDAAAVVASIEYLATEGNRFDWLFGDLVGWRDYQQRRAPSIEGIGIQGARELELQFQHSIPDLPARLALRPASIVRRSGLTAYGTGPFRSTSSTVGMAKLRAFDQYYGGRPFLDEILLVPRADVSLPEEAATSRMLRVLPGAVAPGAVLVRSPTQRLALALICPQSPALQELDIRRQLSERFDRNLFIRATLGGEGTPALGLSPERQPAIAAATEKPAGDLLQRPRRNVRVVVAESEPVLRQLGERLQVLLFALGFDASVETLPADAFDIALLAEQYDVALLGWTPPASQSDRLQESSLVRWVLYDVLQPQLSRPLPTNWSGMLAGAEAATETALLESKHLLPLVFFQDTWQIPATLINVQPGVAQAVLGLDAAHLARTSP